MKFIHISDLHIGKKLHEQDLTDNHEAMFEQLAQTMNSEKPDALLISGDVFQTSTPTYSARKTYSNGMLKLHKASPATQIIIIAGNHDGPNSLDVDRELWTMANVSIFSRISMSDDQQADFDGNLVKIERDGQLLGYVAAVPYTYDHDYPKPEVEGLSNTQAYFAGLTQRARELAGDKPVVLMAHLAVAGDFDAEGHTSREEVIGNLECLNVGDLGGGYDYLALGHIHKRQPIHDTNHKAWYSGTPIEVSFDEEYNEDHAHGFNLVTIDSGAPVISHIKITVPHKLKSLPSKTEFGNFKEVLEQLKSYPADAVDYLRLNVLQKTLDEDYIPQIKKIEEHIHSKVIAVNPLSEKCNGSGSNEIGVTSMEEMRQLTPMSVAKNSLSDELTEDLIPLLQEAITRCEQAKANKSN